MNSYVYEGEVARSRVREEGVGKSVGDFIMVVCAESFDVFIVHREGRWR